MSSTDNGTDSVYESVVIPDLTDAGRKLKNNVVIFSVISIFMFFGDVSISENSSFLGFIFNGLTQEKIYVGLILVILYSSIHYAFLLRDSLSEWALRFSVVSVGSDVNPLGDVSLAISVQNERFNNLYFWWQFHKGYYLELGEKTPDLTKLISDLEMRLESDNAKQSDHVLIKSLLENVGELNNYLREVTPLLNGSPIEDSLRKFDKYYRDFLIFQNVRWLIFEYLVPFCLAFSSLYFLSSRVSMYIFSLF